MHAIVERLRGYRPILLGVTVLNLLCIILLHLCALNRFMISTTCPSPGLTRTVNMEPPDYVLSDNPSGTDRRYNLKQGANFSISCNVTHDNCSFSVDLYKDGAVLRAGDLTNVELTKPRRSPCTMAEIRLVFQNFQAVHDGIYYCYASTNDGSKVLSDEWYLYGSGMMPTCECQHITIACNV